MSVSVKRLKLQDEEPSVFQKVEHESAMKVLPSDFLKKKNPTKFDDFLTFKEDGHRYFYNGNQLTCLSVSSLAKEFHTTKVNLDIMSIHTSKMMYNKVSQWLMHIWTSRFDPNHADKNFEITDESRKTFFKEDRLLVHLTNIEEQEQKLLKNARPTVHEALDDMDDYLAEFYPENIRKNWELSAELGTNLHFYIECKLNEFPVAIPEIPVVGNREYFMVDEFFKKHHFEPWRTELCVYSHEYRTVGMVDFVYVEARDDQGEVSEVSIIDWKRTHKIGRTEKEDVEYSKKRYNPPLQHLKQTTRNDYTLQMSIYAFIIESELNIKVRKLQLGVAHAKNDEMFLTTVPYLKKEVIDMLETIKSRTT